MKKFVVVLLALAMLLTLCACGKKEEEFVLKVGSFDDSLNSSDHSKHFAECASEGEQMEVEYVSYPNMSSALMGLQKEEIHGLPLIRSVAAYIAEHNDAFTYDASQPLETNKKNAQFSMMTLDKNTELYGILDGAIKQLKADGTMDKLIAEDLQAFIKTDPIPEDLPKFEGAKTYKIAVTGDVPPMDFVTADGKAAGFNVALLTEIANIAQINFELVTVDSGARLTALASGSVDAVFWSIINICDVCGEAISPAPDGMLLTEAYFEDYAAIVTLKPAA